MGSPQTFLARRKMPCSSTRNLVRELAATAKEPTQSSIIADVIDSSGMDRNAGSSCERTITL
jgi:hypothetical protein